MILLCQSLSLGKISRQTAWSERNKRKSKTKTLGALSKVTSFPFVFNACVDCTVYEALAYAAPHTRMMSPPHTRRVRQDPSLHDNLTITSVCEVDSHYRIRRPTWWCCADNRYRKSRGGTSVFPSAAIKALMVGQTRLGGNEAKAKNTRRVSKSGFEYDRNLVSRRKQTNRVLLLSGHLPAQERGIMLMAQASSRTSRGSPYTP